MALTARSRANSERPISLDLQVPTYARRTFNHKIYWSKRSHKSAPNYNFIAEVYNNKPCLRRWLEFCYGDPEPSLPYVLCYEPDCIRPNPERIWVLYDGDTPIATYTNLVEAWMIVMGAQAFGDNYNFTLHYVDRTV